MAGAVADPDHPPVDGALVGGDHHRMDEGRPHPGDEPDPDIDELDPREVARDRRRDREAEAERRALMRSGMGKVFKQILDRQVRDVDESPRRHDRRGLTPGRED